jgi:hypothetical protein
MSADAKKRWRTAMHEAGHFVFAHKGMDALFVEAAIDARAESGVTKYKCSRIDPVLSAICSAAGEQSEKFAHAEPPPPDPPPVTGESATPPPVVCATASEARTRALAGIERVKSDSEDVAQWATGGPFWSKYPGVWVKRARFIRASARLFCQKHQAEILNVAQKLYSAGYTVERNPTQNGG